jgi:hypothetical protein
VPSLRELLELRVALPAGVSDDGESVLLLSNRAGTMQLYRVPRSGGELGQLTNFDEPVAGQYVPGMSCAASTRSMASRSRSSSTAPAAPIPCR